MGEMQQHSPELGYKVIGGHPSHPVPDMSELRERKRSLNKLPIDSNHH